MSRLEYKYLVPLADLDAVRQALAPFVEVDGHAHQAGNYTVRSIYFDTPGLDCYYQKEAGIQYRKKIRLRGYNRQEADSLVFLEIKKKSDMAITKSRSPFLYRHVRDLFASGDVESYALETPEFPRAVEEARRFFFHVYRYALYPLALVVYEREAFYFKFDSSLRLTFDKYLRSRLYPAVEELFDEGDLRPSFPGYFILEIKFAERFPSFLPNLRERFHLERTALSKYTICLETHQLPWRASRQSVLALASSRYFR